MYKNGRKIGYGLSSMLAIYVFYHAVCFSFGTWLYLEGLVGTPGELLICILSIVYALFNAMELLSIFETVNQAKAAAENVYKIIEDHVDSKTSKEGVRNLASEESSLSLESGEITFKNVSFAYKKFPDKKILKNAQWGKIGGRAAVNIFRFFNYF